MAVIVKHKESGDQYILLGAGFGAYFASRPSLVFGNLAPTEDSGSVPIVAVCSSEGAIGFLDPDDVEVVSVDGKHPNQLVSHSGPAA